MFLRKKFGRLQKRFVSSKRRDKGIIAFWAILNYSYHLHTCYCLWISIIVKMSIFLMLLLYFYTHKEISYFNKEMTSRYSKKSRRSSINISNFIEEPTCRIPKIFMQTWKNSDVPERWKSSPESARKIMPSWDYRLMTDEMNRDFVKTYFPDFLETYDNFRYPIQRADAIRYMWLYINGGSYMDLDIVLTKSLEEFFNTDCEVYLVRSGNIGSYYTNALMASKARSNFWLECLEEIKRSIANPSPLWIGRHFHVMNTTGPMMLTRVANQSNSVIGLLPSRLLIPCSLCDLPCQYSEDVYAYALPGSSWITWDTLIYNFFFCHWKTIIAIVVILIIAILIFLLAWWLRPRCSRRC